MQPIFKTAVLAAVVSGAMVTGAFAKGGGKEFYSQDYQF
jgi:hypothetical protein